ncbi:MAG: DapH/DapD/GlmU-related protein [Nitriliruptorales bacterium]|nr:DapH/DapD/GlmU-related protein [Nitriliruptorales bacterium]
MTDQHEGPAAGLGIATVTTGGKVLDTWYPHLSLDDETVEMLRDALGGDGTRELTDDVRCPDAMQELADELRAVAQGEGPPTGTRRIAVGTTVGSLADAPKDEHDAYLRLHLLSAREVRPHGLSVDGMFAVLQNVVWTDLGPCDPDGFDELRLRLRGQGHQVRVTSVDKFPRMTDYVIPSGVRIGDADRVRLGAHLAEGTVVMHEGFVNFNAGTLGTAMIEGRISAGVVIGDGSDLGGSASVMGTLSGGGKEVIRIGEGCLVGANAGVGISLGDGCVVEAGLYVTAGMRVTMPDGSVKKAGELSGRPGLLFRRTSETGALEVLERDGEWGSLNEALHENQ